MPPVTRRTRSQVTNIIKEKVMLQKRNGNSPDECPDKKRQAFGDITNARNCQNVIEAKKQTKRSRCVNKENDENVTSSQDTNSSVANSLYLSANESFETSSRPSSVEMKSPTDAVDTKETKVTKRTSGVRQKPWPGVVDFDNETASDPSAVSEYVMDIFEYYKEREMKFMVPKCLEKQSNLTKNMRAILVDWLVEVQESFELNHEALYLAVRLTDLYLNAKPVGKTTLQLLGAVAIFVASKFDERCPPGIEDFLYICDDAYVRRDFLRMEIDLLKTVDFDLGIPLSYSFLRRYARCTKLSMDMLTLARYILELSLTDYDLLDVRDSKIAAGALMLALKMKNMPEWSPTLHYYSGYSRDEVIPIARRLNTMLATSTRSGLKTIRTKYSHKVFFEVAKIPSVTF